MSRRLSNPELGKITETDREYAGDLIEDIQEIGSNVTGTKELRDLIASWFRKVRYEAVMADRKRTHSR